ncbi:MAG: MlaD family protein [Bryobacteraceae bacterium]|jgi:phospholipid/cholesterol/gamma-HCH transport system substrate-binding protein
MPVQKKTTWARLKVGLLALAAIIVLAVVIVLITGDTPLFEGHTTLYTYMNDATGLTDGAPATLNGITIGTVSKVELSGMSDPQHIVKVALSIEDRFLRSIPDDSKTELTAPNLLGTKFVNIIKGASPNVVKPNGTLPGLDTRGFEDVVKQSFGVLTSLQSVVDRVDKIVGIIENGKGSIGKLLVDEELYNRVLAVVTETQKIAVAVNTNQGTIGRLVYDPQLYNDVHGSLQRLDSLLAGLQQGEGTAGKFLKDPTVYNDLQKSIADLRQMIADLNAGKGTAGKLLKSDELSDQLTATINRIDVMLDKVNAGQGTIGQLLVNQQLYDNLNGTSQEMHGLMKDFRANPKKFLRIKLSLF